MNTFVLENIVIFLLVYNITSVFSLVTVNVNILLMYFGAWLKWKIMIQYIKKITKKNPTFTLVKTEFKKIFIKQIFACKSCLFRQR